MGKLVDNVFVLVSYASMMLLRCVVNTETLRRRTLAMQELLHVISAESPVALIVDDVHWADRLSTELLAGLVLHLDKAQLLLVTAARTLPKPSIADTSNAELTLRPLSEPEVFALLTSIAGVKGADWGGQMATVLCQSSKGLPLHVLDALQYAVDRGSLGIENSMWCCANPNALIDEFRPGRSLERRLAGLESIDRALLVTIALADVAIDTGVIASANHLRAEEAESRLGELEHLGLVGRAGPGWTPRHDDSADVLLALSNESQHRYTHEPLANAFANAVPKTLPASKRAPGKA